MGDDEAHTELLVRELESRLLRAMHERGDWRGALFEHAPSLLDPLGASGAVLRCDGEVLAIGDVPGAYDIGRLLDWLAVRMRQPVHADRWPNADAQVASDAPKACRVLAIELSRAAEYLVWFRRGAEDWSPVAQATAAAVRTSLSDLMTQIRALRMLLTHDRLVQSRDLVHAADEAVVILDGSGRCLMANPSFHALLGRSVPLDSVEDVPSLFTEPRRLASLLEAARAGRRAWQGELALRTPDDSGRAVSVRLDPIPRPDGGVLGLIVVLVDLAPRASRVTRRWNGMPLEPAGSARTATSRPPAERSGMLASLRARANVLLDEIGDGLSALGGGMRRAVVGRLRFGRML